jgi:hypothetical protein
MVVFALYLWSALLATVVSVQFWMLAGQLFTVAQGKRLFGPVAAGGVGGAVAGATLAAGALETMSVQSLLLVASALFLATAFGLTTVRTDELVAPDYVAEAAAAEAKKKGLRAMLREVPYLWGVAALVAISVAATLTTDYLFKSIAPVAAERLHLPLGAFLARYYAVLNAASLVVQLFVAGRVLRRFGVIGGLLVLPALLLLGGTASIVLGGVLAVMATKGADGALRHSLHRVSTELMVLPIPGEVRGRAKSVIDTTLARGVQAGTAAAILALAWFDLATPRTLAIVVAGLAVTWLLVAMSLRRPYLDLFRQALRRGSLDMEDAPELDLGSVESVLEALSSPEPATVQGAMELLSQKGRARLIPALILYHHNEEILLRALELVARPDRTDWVPLTERLLAHPSERVRVGAVRALRNHSHALDKARSDPSPAVRAHAAFCLAHCEGRTDLTTDPLIAELLAAPGDAGRAARVAILDSIRDHADPRWADTILAILREATGPGGDGESRRADPELVEHAAAAMAVVKDPRFIDELVNMVHVRDRRSVVRQALVAYEDDAQEALEKALLDPATDAHLRTHLPRSISAFGNQRAADFLTKVLAGDLPGIVRYKALRGLGRLVADHRVRVDHGAIEREILANLTENLRLVALMLPLEEGQQSAPDRTTGCGRLVLGLLTDKHEQSLERAFRLLQITHKNEDLRSVHLAVRSGDKRTRANALEFLDALSFAGKTDGKVRSESRRLLRLVVDDLTPADRVARAGEAVPAKPASYEDSLRLLLRDRDEALAGLAAYHATELGLSAALSAEAVEATRERPAFGIGEALLALRRQTQVAHA